jgi:hypothetical protein
MVSAHNTIKSKRELDFYPTDPLWVHALLRHHHFYGDISEPCCGDGAISKVLINHNVISSDVTDYGYGEIEDALSIPSHQNVITNPPYIIAEKLIDHWLNTTEESIAVLMRLNWLEGQNRYNKYINNRPNKIILITNRMKVFGKTSQFPHAWLVWDKKCINKESIFIWELAK